MVLQLSTLSFLDNDDMIAKSRGCHRLRRTIHYYWSHYAHHIRIINRASFINQVKYYNNVRTITLCDHWYQAAIMDALVRSNETPRL
jgi:hypothetical protein